MPPRVITNVAVDPATPAIAYVTFSGFTGFGDDLGHIFKTTTSGSNWTDISGDLPNTPVDFLVTAPDAPNTLFVGTDTGVFYTTNGGTQWNSLVNGLPRVAVLSMALQASSRTLRAATHGRGVWDLDVSAIVPPALKVVSVTHPASHTFHLQCLGVPNAVNRIESATTPNAQSFTTLTSVMADSSGNFQYNDTTAGTKKFYRLAYP